MRKSTAAFGAAAALVLAGVGAGTASAHEAPDVDVIDADVDAGHLADHALQNVAQNVTVPVIGNALLGGIAN